MWVSAEVDGRHRFSLGRSGGPKLKELLHCEPARGGIVSFPQGTSLFRPRHFAARLMCRSDNGGGWSVEWVGLASCSLRAPAACLGAPPWLQSLAAAIGVARSCLSACPDRHRESGFGESCRCGGRSPRLGFPPLAQVARRGVNALAGARAARMRCAGARGAGRGWWPRPAIGLSLPPRPLSLWRDIGPAGAPSPLATWLCGSWHGRGRRGLTAPPGSLLLLLSVLFGQG